MESTRAHYLAGGDQSVRVERRQGHSRRVILNELISNALKHAFPDGRHGAILVRGELHDGRVELVVQDDGAGVSGTNGGIGGKTAEWDRPQSLDLKLSRFSAAS